MVKGKKTLKKEGVE